MKKTAEKTMRAHVIKLLSVCGDERFNSIPKEKMSKIYFLLFNEIKTIRRYRFFCWSERKMATDSDWTTE